MSKIFRLVGILALVAFLATMIVFSFGLILVAVAMIGGFGLYHRFVVKRRAKTDNVRSSPMQQRTNYNSGEVIDMPIELNEKPENQHIK